MQSATRRDRILVLVLALQLAGGLASCGDAGQDGGAGPSGGELYPLARAQGVDPRGLESARSVLAANPDTRWLLVERVALSACVDWSQAENLGVSNRREWWLVPARAACQHP